MYALRRMDYRTRIARALAELLRGQPFGLARSDEEVDALLEQPKESRLGDWAFPCFTLARELRRAPAAIASELREPAATALAGAVREVQAVGPYLNFFLDKSAVAASVVPAVLDGSFLARRPPRGERVMVEYSQPNTHKAFHVGHIRCAALGDSLARLLEWRGDDAIPVNYIGDEGTHVAKCLWYLRTRFTGDVPEENRGEFLGELYTRATALLDLSLMTRAPHPGVTAARVLAVEPHAEEPRWIVVRLETAAGEASVVSAAGGFEPGDLVPWARPGLRVAGKEVGRVERKGVASEGMIASERELGLSEDDDHAPRLPTGTRVGAEVADVYALPGAVDAGRTVLEVLREREREVGEVLAAVESGAGEVHDLWRRTRQWSLDEFLRIYEWLGCRFDHWFYESEFGEAGKALVREYQERGVFVESEGAVGADLRADGLGFCLLIKSNGTALYATRDLALARRKFDEFGVDRSLYVVDAAQSLHFQQVFRCLGLMGYPQAARCEHLAYAQVVLPDGKMSSRKGNVILFSELKQRLLAKIHGEYLDKYRGEWSDEEIELAGHRIALATMRYGMLLQTNESQIVFDLDEWSSRSGNTGPYMMYAYTRTRSILREAGLREVGETETGEVDWSLLDHETEQELLGHLAGYPAALERAAQTSSPSVVCASIYELSRKFNRMYRHCSVLHAETPELRTARLRLVDAVGRVIRHGLGLLGVATVERM